MISNEPVRRPFELGRVNLSGHWLEGDDFGGANLYGANLSGAILNLANLTGANLFTANLTGADLGLADLDGANLSFVDLSGADLRYAKDLTQEQLDEACGGNADTKLTEGLTLKAICRTQLQAD